MSHAARRSGLFVAIAAAAVSAAAYASTIMVAVNGGDSPFTEDAGEFQVALAEWGTVHHTGYPLYMMLGSPFVAALRSAGVPPSAGASLFSLAWEVAAVCGVALIALRLTGRAWLAALIGVTFALARSIWIYGSVAKVYSMSMAITAALLWVTLDLLEGWDDRRGWLLALLGGIGVAHHRLVGVGLPVIGLMLLPSALAGAAAVAGRRGTPRAPATAARPPSHFLRWLAVATLCFALGFLPYLDMPWRVWRGATWVYGQPDTWSGFWYLFFAREVEGWQQPTLEWGALMANARDVAAVMATELTWPGVVAAVAGTGLAVWQRRTRRVGILLAGMALSYMAFATLVNRAVHIEADLMAASLCLLLGLGLGIEALMRMPAARARGRLLPVAFLVLLAAWSVALFALHRPFILSIARNPEGVDYIRQVEGLEAPPGSVVMAPWGWRYFALSYAQRIERRMTQWNIVDHRADFAALARESGRVYTAADTFYIFTALDFWAPRLGGAHLSSAGPGMVEIARIPKLVDSARPAIPLGDGVALLDVEVRPPLGEAGGLTDVVVWWAATARPTRDYSTFVHVSDQDAIGSADDLIAQDDQIAPVYAWYATTRWSPGEVVREDHALRLPPGRRAKLIVVGMYYRDDAGDFVNLGSVEVRNVDGEWQLSP